MRIQPIWLAVPLVLVIFWGLAISSMPSHPPQGGARYAASGDGNDQCVEPKTFWQRTTCDPVALSTVFVAVFTFVLTVAAILQLTALGKANKTSRIAAQAAKQSADALLVLEGGYLVVRPTVTWSTTKFGRVAAIDCTLVNYGRTPVILWRFESDFSLFSRPFEPDNTGGISRLFPGGHVLKRDEEWSMEPRTIAGHAFMSEEAVNAIECGGAFIWFYGSVDYEDVFGNQRCTRFRWAWNGLAESFLPYGGKPYNERT